jgi:DNA-binding response OmpR family regulator
VILDEHEGSRLVMCRALQLRGHVCEPAATAWTALAAIDSIQAQVVIYEWDLRDRSGHDFAATVRARAAQLGRTPRILVVSSIDEPEGFRARQPVDDYFTKPVDLDALDRALRRFAVTTPSTSA